MLPLISVVIVILSALGLRRLLPVIRKHRCQVRFIRETLTSSRKSDGRRVIASLSTVPERIGNLGPTIRSLLRQMRPPDEIVVAVPEFSIREQRSYAVPKYVSRWPRLRVLHCRKDLGPATKFTGCGSYFIQSRFFDESLWDYSKAPNGAFYMDDIWISGCLTRRNVKRYVVPASAMMRSVFRQRRTLSLHDVPNGRQYNNNETIAFFGDIWDVLASR